MIDRVELTIWGRQFSLMIDYCCHKDEVPTKKQEKAVKRLISHPEWIEKSKNALELYCKNDVLEDTENENKENVFSYVKPHYILVKRIDNQPKIGLMCNYKYDLEHGIAIVFSSTGKATIVSQDEIL